MQTNYISKTKFKLFYFGFELFTAHNYVPTVIVAEYEKEKEKR